MNVYIPTGNITDMQGPCDEGFHIPSKDEWEGVGVIMGLLNLDTSSGWKQNLKMPYTGYRSHSDGLVGTSTQGVLGQYRSCSFYDDPNYNFYASILYLTGGTVSKNYASSKSDGITIRPFHDGYVAPDSSWTVIQGTLGSAGIFWDTVNGLISITGDGTTGYTIADKNLGATTVYSDGDTLAETNCGKYYQWGNNNGFAWTGSVTTSSTLVNASAYGPGNYYSSSTFITTSASPYDWSSVQNDNLRGGVTGIVSPAELKNSYIGEYVQIGIFHNSTLGLISLSSDGENWITISDKNLGATTVYNDGDTLSEANCGKYYQWGNNYGFPRTGSVTTSSSQVNASTYGPGNYYSSSTYRTSSGAPWDSSNNTNLWGGDTGTNAAMQGPCPSGYHLPTNNEITSLKTLLTSLGIDTTNGTCLKTYLKMPRAGRRTNNGSTNRQGTYAYYATSRSSSYTSIYSLVVDSSSFLINNGQLKVTASSIRPFKNEAVQPTTDWTVIYQPN